MTEPVCVSSKTWEGDYRHVLDPDSIRQMFGPFEGAARRQIVLNRIVDRPAAAAMADHLVAAGLLDTWAWAEEMWPVLSGRLDVPEGWFGPAWPYSAPELCELDLAGDLPLLHLAGDVRFDAPPGWAATALRRLAETDRAAVVTALPPTGKEATLVPVGPASDGWSTNTGFSDQLFLVHPADLLTHEVITTTHPAAARYPKPGGALTFEARVGAWLAARDRLTLVDVGHRYVHPVWGSEGDSYHWTRLEDPPAPPEPGASYPPTLQGVTGLVVSEGDVRTVGAAAASLRWCGKVVTVEAAASESAGDQATRAGAEVVRGPTGGGRPAARRWAVGGITEGWVVCLDGNEVCPPGLAARLAAAIQGGTADVVEARRLSMQAGGWTGPDRVVVAFRAGAVTFGKALDLLPMSPRPGTSVARIDDPEVIRLAAADMAGLVTQLNIRSSQRALSLVIDRKPTFSLPARRFAAAWAQGRGLRASVLDAVEEWLLLEKWEEAWHGGGVAAAAEFEELAWGLVSGGQPSMPRPAAPPRWPTPLRAIGSRRRRPARR